MNVYKEKLFVKLFDDDHRLPFQDLSFENCTFDNCGLALNAQVGTRSIIQNVNAQDCTVINCEVGPAVFEDVSIDSLKTNDLLIMWGAVFKHVRFNGRIGKIKINKRVDPTNREQHLQQSFDRANKAFYSAVDWALDISDAIFREFQLEGVPSDLVIRDSNSQAIVRREKALKPEWRNNVSPFNSYWPFVIDMFLDSDDADIILVAPKAKPRKQLAKLLDGLKELRDLGVAEPY